MNWVATFWNDWSQSGGHANGFNVWRNSATRSPSNRKRTPLEGYFQGSQALRHDVRSTTIRAPARRVPRSAILSGRCPYPLTHGTKSTVPISCPYSIALAALFGEHYSRFFSSRGRRNEVVVDHDFRGSRERLASPPAQGEAGSRPGWKGGAHRDDPLRRCLGTWIDCSRQGPADLFLSHAIQIFVGSNQQPTVVDGR